MDWLIDQIELLDWKLEKIDISSYYKMDKIGGANTGLLVTVQEQIVATMKAEMKSNQTTIKVMMDFQHKKFEAQ